MFNNTKKGSNKIAVIFVIIIAILVLIYALTDFITDLIWFNEVGYTSVFLTELVTKVKIGAPTFVIVVALAFVFLTALKGSFLKKNNFQFQPEDKGKIRKIILALSIALSLFVTIVFVGELWFKLLEFINSSDFNIEDPLFGNDIGFYMFKYGLLSGLADCAISVVVAFVIGLVLFYAIIAGYAKPREEGASNFQQETLDYYKRMMEGKDNFKQKLQAILGVASREITILGVLFFIFVGFKMYLAQYSVLYDQTGLFYGGGFAEINVTLLFYRILMVLSIVAAIMLVVGIKKKKVIPALAVPALMVVLFLLSGVVHGLVQTTIVEPDELNKEREYMGYNINYTRLAYDINQVKVKEFVPESTLTKEQVLDNMETFSNIRINDFDPTQLFYNQTQSIRTYYTFNDVDVDRYYINNEYTQVFLSAREIDADRSDDSWLIQHIKYTHGYGLTLSRVDKITSSGQPDMLIKSIPPVSDIPEITITRPEIYYGELTSGYVIVNTNEQEFDYPSGETNVYCDYEGTGGIKLNLFNRILFAIKENSFKLLISTNITGNSKIMVYRNIAERIEKIAPFLTYDDDPYVVTVDGKIYWIADGYTTSSMYPYSEPYSYSGINYIRNSVKVIVDAYNGDVSFYICDEDDPIIQTYAKIYPELFKGLDELPEGFEAHLQYPNALFNIQASVYERYHMTDVDVFYQNEDRWDISKELYGQTETTTTANYSIMKLPGEENAEFVSTISFTPVGKSNLSSILVARQDGEHYGELVVYRMPKDRQIYGTSQIEAKVNQDAEISKEFSLWNNSGSTYSRGNMFVIPVENSILYVEPVYLYASTGSLPEVKRVICFYDEQIAYESTLAECLDALFGDGAGDPLNTAYPIVSGHEAAEALRNGGGSTNPDDPGKVDPSNPDDKTDVNKLLDQLLKDWENLGKQIEEIRKQLNGN